MKCSHCDGTGEEPGEKVKALTATARRVLEFLNRKAGRNYQPDTVNLEFIRNRLKDGATEAQCRAVIGLKVRDWKDDETMAKYLRPATLFNKTKFSQYRGELPATAFQAPPAVPETVA
jgi:uncharacterized phage protein (TIGR02220 family)